jgi:hypothetical protein
MAWASGELPDLGKELSKKNNNVIGIIGII